MLGNDHSRVAWGLREVEGQVSRAVRCRRNLVEPESGRSRPSVGREPKVFHLAGLCLAKVPLNDAATPVVGTGVAERPEYTVKGIRCVGPLRELQLDRVERYGILSGKVAATVDESSLRHASASGLKRESSPRDPFGVAEPGG